jgi:hypothetical protein
MQNHGDTTGSMTATQDSSVAPEHMLTEPWTLEGFDMSFLDNFMEGPVVT